MDAIRRTIERQGLWRPGARVLVALSGGGDSVALLFLLKELEADGLLTVAGAAHLNHQLRADAGDDEAFCARLAARLGVPFIADRAADRAGADVIAVAHTKEDQAETFLLRMLRGAGTRGLAGIRPRMGLPAAAPQARRWVVRPLLEIERAALRAYLSDRGEPFREDATNADVAIPRNRVRHELIPFLRTRFSPAIADVLAREAALAREDEEFLSEKAIELADRIVLTSEATTTIDAAGLGGAPRALSSRVAAAALQRFAGRKPIGFDHVERLLALKAGQAVSLPGQCAVRTGDVIALRRGRGGRDGSPNSFAFSLSIPGEVHLSLQELVIRAEYLDGRAAAPQWKGRGQEVGVAAAALELPLVVRGRKAGDRFRPLGAPGARKLQDFLVDRKVSRTRRDDLPLVVDRHDRIVWVVGQAVAEDFRVTDPAQGVILLKVRHLGGPG